MIDVKQYLTANNIRFQEYAHQAVFSTKEAEEYCKDVPGLGVKNLFLKDKRNNRFCLFVLPGEKKLDFKKVDAILGSKQVAFGNSEELKEKLGVDPGSVSIFCILNDTSHEVGVFLDKEVYEADSVGFHPNVNTSTLVIVKEELEKFLGLVRNKTQVVEL